MAIQVWPPKEEVKNEGETWPPKTAETVSKVEVSVGDEVVSSVKTEEPVVAPPSQPVSDVPVIGEEEQKPRRGRPRKG